MSFNKLIELAKDHAKKAVEFDIKSLYEQAVFYYTEASQCLLEARQLQPELFESNDLAYSCKLNQYITRAETLKKLQNSAHTSSETLKSEIEVILILKNIEQTIC